MLIALVKGISIFIFMIFILHEGTKIHDKYQVCNKRKMHAQRILAPGTPCSDLETRLHLEGEFLRCNEAKEVVDMSIFPCVLTRWLDEWIPTKLMSIITANPLSSTVVGIIMFIITLYISVNAIIIDRAHERNWQRANSNTIQYHNNNAYDRLEPASGRITYVHDNNSSNMIKVQEPYDEYY